MTDIEWLKYWLIVTKGDKARAEEHVYWADRMCADAGATREEFVADRESGLMAADFDGETETKRPQ